MKPSVMSHDKDSINWYPLLVQRGKLRFAQCTWLISTKFIMANDRRMLDSDLKQFPIIQDICDCIVFTCVVYCNSFSEVSEYSVLVQHSFDYRLCKMFNTSYHYIRSFFSWFINTIFVKFPFIFSLNQLFTINASRLTKVIALTEFSVLKMLFHYQLLAFL